jgi:phosphotransferase system HPr (HPr) family protein
MPASSEPRRVAEAAPATDTVERIVILPKHLHARPAGQIAQAAARHPTTTIELSAGHKQANARSVLAVMGLGAVAGTEVRVIVAGCDADAVTDEVVDILCSPESEG